MVFLSFFTSLSSRFPFKVFPWFSVNIWWRWRVWCALSFIWSSTEKIHASIPTLLITQLRGKFSPGSHHYVTPGLRLRPMTAHAPVTVLRTLYVSISIALGELKKQYCSQFFWKTFYPSVWQEKEKEKIAFRQGNYEIYTYCSFSVKKNCQIIQKTNNCIVHYIPWRNLPRASGTPKCFELQGTSPTLTVLCAPGSHHWPYEGTLEPSRYGFCILCFALALHSLLNPLKMFCGQLP